MASGLPEEAPAVCNLNALYYKVQRHNHDCINRAEIKQLIVGSAVFDLDPGYAEDDILLLKLTIIQHMIKLPLLIDLFEGTEKEIIHALVSLLSVYYFEYFDLKTKFKILEFYFFLRF